MNEEDDLVLNNILPDTFARKIYDRYRSHGLDHKSAARKVIQDIESIESKSMDEPTLEGLKIAMKNVKGQWY